MSAPLIPRPFSQAWSLEDSRQMVAAQEGLPPWADPRQKAWKAEHYDPINDKLIAAIGGHLSMLAHSGQLVQPDNAQAISLEWKQAWEKLVDTPNDIEAAMELGEMFLRPAMMFLSFSRQDLAKGKDPEALEKAHVKIVEKMERGDFGYYDTEMGECADTGARMHLVLTAWQPVLGLVEFVPNPDGGYDRSQFVPLQPGQFSKPGVEHLTIEMPSGHLLVSDWFRIEAFNTLSNDMEKEKNRGESSSVQGFIHQTRDYAQEMGFVSVFGSSNVSVFQDGNRLVIGGEDANEPLGAVSVLGRDLGGLCGSLRWTSVIDRQVLVDLVASKVGIEEAQAQVADWEKENAREIIQVTVTPGTYHLYCSGRSQVFSQEFKMEEVDVNVLEYPMFVLSDQPLTPKPARSRAPKR